MTLLLTAFVVLAGVLRVAALLVSIRNEKRMKAAGAAEYGSGTSTLLALAHIAFYLAAIAEGFWRALPVSIVTFAGLILYGLAMCALIWVMVTLGRFWTVKIIIAKDHDLVTNRLFRLIRHPNYYLNMVPELIGFALVLQSYATLFLGLPVYLTILLRRIRQEEKVMREAFQAY